jgi:CIC family chloride channel protein
MLNSIKSLFSELHTSAVARSMLFASLVGIVAGLGAVGFYYATNYAQHFFMSEVGGFHPPEEGAAITSFPAVIDGLFTLSFSWYLCLIPLIGGLISGLLVSKFAPEAEGHGTDAAIEAFHEKGGHIRGRVPIIKALASIATISTGGSAGREGPIAQIGAGFASFLATKLGLTAADRRILLIAGMAGGVGATFRSPLGGALFAVEVLYRDAEFEHEGLVAAIISSIVAYSLFGSVTGWEPLLSTPHFVFRHPLELVSFLAMGVMLAFSGVAYVKIFYGFRDWFGRLPGPDYLRPVFGAAMLGVLAFFVPHVLGSGYGWIQAALYGKMALWVMVVVAIAKVLATSFTISSGGSGGVFAPSLVIGAMLGGAFGLGAQALAPGITGDPRAYVLVGMAGFFAAVSKTPIATLIMVSELTGNYGLLAPLMLVCTVSMLVRRKNTIYENQVPTRLESKAHLGDFVVDVTEGVTVADMADQGMAPTYIPQDMVLPAVMQKIAAADGAYYYVTDAQGDVIGVFSVNDIRRILDEDIPAGLIIARDIATHGMISTTPEESLGDALKKLSGKGLEEIPVVDPDNPAKVLFTLTRRTAIARYTSELEKKRGIYAEQ